MILNNVVRMKGTSFKKIVSILTTILVLQLIFTNLGYSEKINQTTNNTIIVDIKGQGDYISIQKAIDNAKTGSIIYVKNGEYDEIIEISKSVNLIGEDKDNTIICPTSQRNRYAMLLAYNDITISNISVYNKASGIYTSAIRIIQSDNKIDNCSFFNTPIGIVIWSSNNIIKNCKFWGCSDEGIALIGGNNIKCGKNSIRKCIFYDNCDGIELQYSSENQILDCEFYNNSHAGIDAIVSNNNKNVISNCKIYNNEAYGIYMASSDENRIINCELYGNQNDNIVFNQYSKDNIIFYPVCLENQNENKVSTYKALIKSIFEKLLDRLSISQNTRLFQYISDANF